MREAIDSALAQTYRNVEIIVVNDGSTDNTEEIALTYGDKLRYFKKDNGGQSSALNLGIEKMNGDYFSWLSHDDVYYPNKIERQVQILDGLEDKSTILFTDWDIINSESVITSRKKVILSPRGICYDLLVSSPVHGCSALIQKDILVNSGLFNRMRPQTSDVELFFNLFLKYNYLLISEPLIQSRVHSRQATYQRRPLHLKESNLFLIESFEKYCSKIVVSDEVKIEIALNWSIRGYNQAVSHVLSELNWDAFYFLKINTNLFLWNLKEGIRSAKRLIKMRMEHKRPR